MSFEFSGLRKLPAFSAKRSWIFVLLRGNSAPSLSRIAKGWALPGSVLEIVEAKLKKTWEAEQKPKPITQGHRKTFCVTVPLTEGGQIQVLVLDKGVKTFELHESLRKNLAGFVKLDPENSAVFHLSDLALSLQATVLDGLAALSILEKWELTRYGLRAQKDENKSTKKTTAKQAKVMTVDVISTLKPSLFSDVVMKSQILSACTNQVRTLAELPPNVLTAGAYRKHIEELAKKRKFKTEFFDRKKLLKMGAGSFLAVTQADPKDEGGIMKLSYAPKKKSQKPLLALIGKGVCYDTGGYNVKPAKYMMTMRRDMTGSAVALSLLCALQDLDFDRPVECFLALAENHISPTGYKPDDVVTAMDGTSIEVIHTDAEGRMLLADTLALARRSKPAMAIDFATLTGTCQYALDTRRSGVFSNSDSLAAQAVKAGDQSGERVWSFPIGEDYKDSLKSEVADILQCTAGSNADHIYGATFLSHFIGDQTPWVHVDLSAEENKGGLGLVSGSTTGFGVRFGYQLLQFV